MVARSDARTDRYRRLRSRLARGLLFVGIVWSIAGVFAVLRSGLPNMAVAAMARGWIPAQLGMSKELAAAAEQHCAGVGQEAGKASADPAYLGAARYVAVEMGESFGAAGAMVNMGLPREQAEPLLDTARQAAGMLGVPAPELPEIQHHMRAMIEFSDHLEADRQCVAAWLASLYSRFHGDAFKFGAVIGHSQFYCLKGRCSAYATEIRHYGQRAGVPDHLWLPLARGSLDGVPGNNPVERIAWLMARRNEHLRAGQ